MKKCIALLIGINNYKFTDYWSTLTNPVRDVEEIASVLRDLRFEVEVCCDEDDATTETYWGDFLQKISNNKPNVALFYFAGHGAMVNHYDCILWKECGNINESGGALALRHAQKVEELLASMRSEGNQMNIIIIDACRQVAGMRGYGNQANSTTCNVPYQTFLAYSTSPGAGAQDAPSKLHSPFAQALLNHLKEPELPIEMLFKKVRQELNPQGLRQLSWDCSCLIDDFSFNYGQLNEYYDKPYSEGAYKYGNGFVPPSEQMALVLAELKGKGDGSGIKAKLATCSINKAEIDDDTKFVIGRLIGEKAASGNLVCRRILNDNSFFNLYNEGDINHLLRGIFYSLYYDEWDHLREEIIGDVQYWEDIERLYGLLGVKADIKHFIEQALENNVEKFKYVVGQKNMYRFRLGTVDTNCMTEQGEELLGLKLYDEEGICILPILDIEEEFFGDEELRKAIANYYHIPMQWISLDSKIDADESKKYTKLWVEDVNQFLLDYMMNHISDDVSCLSSMSYITDIEELMLKSVEEEDGQLTAEGSCTVWVHVEYDHDEEPEMSFPCTFKLVCNLEDEGEYILDNELCEYKVDTNSYYE